MHKTLNLEVNVMTVAMMSKNYKKVLVHSGYYMQSTYKVKKSVPQMHQ